MPRSKRPLSHVDSNSNKAQPPSKRKTTVSVTGKENEVNVYNSMKKAELCTLLEDRQMPTDGTKAVLIARLKGHDNKSEGTETNGHIKNGSNSSQPAQVFKWQSICNLMPHLPGGAAVDSLASDLGEEPVDDDQGSSEATREEESSEDDPREEDKDKQETGNESEHETPEHGTVAGMDRCVCIDPDAGVRECQGVVTEDGWKLVTHLQREVDIRDQDAFMTHVFSRYNSYGFQEVMENHLLSFDRAFCERKPSATALWAILEGFAWILLEQQGWMQSEDPDHILDTLEILGGAVFSTLNILDKHDLFRPDSPLKNIPLVLRFLYVNTMEWPEDDEDDENGPKLMWRYAMIWEAQQRGFVFKDPLPGYYAAPRDAGVDGTSGDKPKPSKWMRFKWKSEFLSFCKKYRTGLSIGGTHYVLETAQEEQERTRYFGIPGDHSRRPDVRYRGWL